MRYRLFIKKFLLPPFFLNVLRKIKTSIGSSNKYEYAYECPICRNKLNSFVRLPDYFFEMLDKYQYVHSIFCGETMNVLNYSCPKCETSDRDRLYCMYFEKRFSTMALTGLSYTFLDVAPSNLRMWIKNHPFISYRSVDLYAQDVDDKADITNLYIYEANRFDIILCSHVLEHVVDDRKAMLELFRVLKPGGFAILMAPILLSIQEDLENPIWTSEADRWKYYGQGDHMRMYSKAGYIKKLEQSGFKVHQHGVDYFGKDLFRRYGIHERSVLYVVAK